MIIYLVRRLGQAVLLLFGAVTIVFLVLRVIPGDPAALILGSQATAEQLAAKRDELGLSDPLFLQYLHHLGEVVRLDFGDSWRLGGDAFDAVLGRLPATITLAGYALVFTLLLGFPLGLRAARHKGKFVDRAVSYFSLTGQALPAFWVGIMLVLIFSRTLDVLPATADGSALGLVLPAFTLALPFLGWLARLVRNGTLEELGKDYVRTARSKGLTERVVFDIHVLRNTLTPIVTVLGLVLGHFIADAVIIEQVFAWPGIGSLMIESIQQRDYAVAEAAIILIAVFYLCINVVVDLLYFALDPRVTLETV